jgi:LuxR family maltose regulon positive regulatory protein
MSDPRISPARRHIVKRPRLTRLLDETSARIVLVIGAAGYGKTTLAREWESAQERTTTWYTGSPASSDVAALAMGVSDSVRTLVPGAGTQLIDRLRASDAPQPDVAALVELLAGDLDRWPEEAWLVFDDYHHAMESTASEEFVDGLLRRTAIRVLITSRKRPTWATARRILYGEIHEVGQHQLALTPEEAREVLVERPREEIAGLVALAEGWPAVIGLAALAREPLAWQEELPNELHDYFAEELYRAATPRLQEALCQMAAAPSLDKAVLSSLFDSDGGTLAARADEIGFLSAPEAGRYELHPLLRSFLERKLRERGEAFMHGLVERLSRALIDLRRWDDVGQLIERFDAGWLVERLVRNALDDVLRDGRIETLSRWLASGPSDAPIVALANAEIAYRQGEYSKAETLAARAAAALAAKDPLVSRAWFRAGQAADFAGGAGPGISQYFQLAFDTAQTVRSHRNALWGLFNSAVEQGRPDALKFLDDYRDAGPLDIADEMRLANGLLFHASIFGDKDNVLGRVRGLRTLAEECHDPMVRSSFLNILGHNLVLAAYYDEALDVAAEALQHAHQAQLAFAVPHALLFRAKAQLGLRRFALAQRSVEEALSQPALEDVHVAANASATAAKIQIARGRAREACEITARAWTLLPGGMMSEFLATRALALACDGQISECARTSDEALRAGESIVGRVLTASTGAALAVMNQSEDAPRLVREAFARAVESGDVDSFVLVCRGLPDLATATAQYCVDRRSEFTEMLMRSHDRDLARRAGLPTAFATEREPDLSKRENEVLDLVVEGLSNREIAARLFISEVTVKVHLRNIFAKMGVRSRTEAAVRAATRADSPLPRN